MTYRGYKERPRHGSNMASEDDQKRIEVVTPQFERTDGRTPADPPAGGVGEWYALRQKSEDELRELGLQPWGEHGLWVFPFEWHDHVPEAMLVVDIFGRVNRRSTKPDRADKRLGALSYGIVPLFEEGVDA